MAVSDNFSQILQEMNPKSLTIISTLNYITLFK